MLAPEPADGVSYRVGDLDTRLSIFLTPFGTVYTDAGGGGMAWSESCRAMTQFSERNGWMHAEGCLDGQLGAGVPG
jgi:hypothetical protein